jgi:DNA-binding Xre family transcriptional regulator
MWRIKWNVKRFWVGELDLDNVDLAELTKIRPGTIGEIMKDAHDGISLADLAAICQALHRNVDEVLLLIKDTEDIEGVERDKAILESVRQIRAERRVSNAQKREQEKEARKRDEEQRIKVAVEKALMEFGIIDAPVERSDLLDCGSGEGDC